MTGFDAPPPPPPPSSRRVGAGSRWLTRNFKWVLPVAIVGGLVIGGGALALFFHSIFGAMRSSEVYQTAFETAIADPEVIEHIGTPIEAGFFLSGNLHTGEDSGFAVLAIPVTGPSGEATIVVEAVMESGVWSYQTLQAVIHGLDEPIDLLP